MPKKMKTIEPNEYLDDTALEELGLCACGDGIRDTSQTDVTHCADRIIDQARVDGYWLCRTKLISYLKERIRSE